MAEHHDHDTNDAHYQNENLEQWQLPCEQCIRTFSSSRPPVFNADNCSCAEVASHTRGGQHLSQSPFYEQPTYHYENTLPVYHQQPQSYASSSISVPSPDGPEREDPNNFLPLGPEAGLNETQHRRLASFHSDMSYQMRRFLVEQEEHQHPAPYATEHGPTETRFLPQDIYIQSQAPAKGKKSKLSCMSASISSGDASLFSWDVDPVTGIGAWIDAEGNLYAGDSYPLAVSGEFIYDDTN